MASAPCLKHSTAMALATSIVWSQVVIVTTSRELIFNESLTTILANSSYNVFFTSRKRESCDPAYKTIRTALVLSALYVSFCFGSWTRSKVTTAHGTVTIKANMNGNVGETDS